MCNTVLALEVGVLRRKREKVRRKSIRTDPSPGPLGTRLKYQRMLSRQVRDNEPHRAGLGLACR